MNPAIGEWVFLSVYALLVVTHVGGWLYIQAMKVIRKTRG